MASWVSKGAVLFSHALGGGRLLAVVSPCSHVIVETIMLLSSLPHLFCHTNQNDTVVSLGPCLLWTK